MAGLALASASCDGSEPSPTEEELTLKKISKNWALTSAEVDDTDVAEWFAGLKVSYTESKTFTVQNAVPPIWVASGTFELEKSGSSYVIKRSDGVDMTISSLTDTDVTVTLNYTAPVGARKESISGTYSFSFQAQ